MRLRTPATLVLISALLAIALPILLSIYLARKEGLRAEQRTALTYAREVLHRSDSTADQIEVGIAALTAANAGAPCSPKNIALMGKIDLASSYIQAIVHMSGNQVECSSLGKELNGLNLGPVDLVQPSGVRLRTHVLLPFAPQTMFMTIESHGYAAIIHKDLAIDVLTDTKNASLAILSAGQRKVLAARGFVDPQWLDALAGNKSTKGKKEARLVDDDYVVAVAVSSRYLFAAVCALPVSQLDMRVRRSALILVPVGLLAGLLLAFAVVYWGKWQSAMPAVIRAALRRNEFFLRYQPIVDLRNGRWIGAEALIRWQPARGEAVGPDIFIPVAEECGLIGRITERVVDLVGRDAVVLFREHPDFHVGINLSATDLHDAATVDLLRRLEQDGQAEPRNFMIEATERCLMEPEIAGTTLRRLRERGYRLAVDDFGTGYSSLSYLGNLAFDLLKIDKSFVDAIDTGAATSEVVPHLIEMARALKLEMIAEGVETEAQASYLRAHGVQYAQGWLFARPMPLDELLAALNRQYENEAQPA